MDKTFIKVQGHWGHLYRVIDRDGAFLHANMSPPIADVCISFAGRSPCWAFWKLPDSNSCLPNTAKTIQARVLTDPQAQRFLAAHGMIYGHFRPRRHLMAAGNYRRARAKVFEVWRQETCVQMMS